MNAIELDKTTGVKKRRKYTAEFKRDAVNRVLRTTKPCTQVGEELDINPNMLARWRGELIGNMDKASAPEELLSVVEVVSAGCGSEHNFSRILFLLVPIWRWALPGAQRHTV